MSIPRRNRGHVEFRYRNGYGCCCGVDVEGKDRWVNVIGRQVGDSVEGERLGHAFRRIRRERVVVGSGRHRTIKIVIEETSAKACILKPLRAIA